MGVDLTLMPAFGQDAQFSQDMLRLARDPELFRSITVKEREHGAPVKKGGVHTYMAQTAEIQERHYGAIDRTPYGQKLMYITANHLKEAFAGVAVDGWKNKAIKAFINELPDDLEVFLYWH